MTGTGDDVATSISVDDGVTKKRVARDLDLRSIPADGRAMMIALALDELLRASWAELTLIDAPVKTPVPAVVREAIAAPTPPKRPPEPSADVGVSVGGEHYGAGVNHLGFDVFGAYFPWRHLGLHARAGLRFGFETDAPRGSVDSTALVVAVGPRIPIVPLSNRFGAELLSEAIVSRVTFAATSSSPTAHANE